MPRPTIDDIRAPSTLNPLADIGVALGRLGVGDVGRQPQMPEETHNHHGIWHARLTAHEPHAARPTLPQTL